MVLKMNWQDIFGHEAEIAKLKTLVEKEQMPHAVLFIGPEGIGKSLVAKIMAAALFCADKKNAPCGECFSCRQFFSNQHPDFFSVEPEGTSIKIEQIRQVQNEIALSPYLSDKRIVLIDAANLMTVQSANCLLKTLEEPQGNVVFILISESRQRLLDTILSRCQVFAFKPLEFGVLAKALRVRSIDGDQANVIAKLADGSMGKALALWEKGGLALRSQAGEVLGVMQMEDIWRISSALGELERGRLIEVLDYLNMLWRDMLILHEDDKSELIYNIDLRDFLNDKIAAWSTRRLLMAMQVLSRLRIALRANANAKLAMEAFLLKLKDL